MQLREIMTSDTCCASPTDSVTEVAAHMKRHNVGAMPICRDGALVGILTDRDIVVECVASGNDPDNCLASNFMTSQLVSGRPDMDVVEAAHLMGKEQVHRLPVMENGRLVGIVSLGDVAFHCQDDRVVAQLLREVSVPVRSIKMEAVAA